MKSILDPTFRYVCAAETDIRMTFARARMEMELAREDEGDRRQADTSEEETQAEQDWLNERDNRR